MKKNTNSEIDKSLYSEKSLYLLNIRELRDLGRKFGVPAPTTLKKQELVDYILKVVYGEVKVPVRSNYGRPSVREFDMDKYVSKIQKNSEISSELKGVKLKNFGTMKVADVREKYIENEIETRVFCKDGEKFYLRVREFVASPDDIEISHELAEKFKLEDFDVVEITRNGDMFKIISINGIKRRMCFDKISLEGTRLRSGKSQDFYLSTKEEMKEALEKLSRDCEVSDIKLIALSKEKLPGKTTECVLYGEEEESSRIYKKIVYLIGLCEKAVFDGQDFILAIEDADKVEENLEYFEKDVSLRIKKYIQNSIPRFSSLGNVVILLKCEKEVNY